MDEHLDQRHILIYNKHPFLIAIDQLWFTRLKDTNLCIIFYNFILRLDVSKYDQILSLY